MSDRAVVRVPGVVAHVGDTAFGPVDVPRGGFGLAVEDCTLHFQGITQTK